MTAAQKFTRMKSTAKTIVYDALWDTVNPEKFERPEVVPHDDFQNCICRVSTTHLRGSIGQKHNARTAIHSLDIHIAWLCSCMSQFTHLISVSDGSLKEHLNAPFLRGIAELAKKHNVHIIHLLHAAAHGSTPSDAEQCVIKEFNDDLGPYNESLPEAAENTHRT